MWQSPLSLVPGIQERGVALGPTGRALAGALFPPGLRRRCRSPRRAALRRLDGGALRPAGVGTLARGIAKEGVGGVRQAALWLSGTGAQIPGALYPPRRHQQSPAPVHG